MRNVVETARDFGEFLLSPRGIASILGNSAIVLAAYLAFKSGEKFFEAENFSVPEIRIEGNFESEGEKLQKPVDAYRIIQTRNIFGATAPVATPPPAAGSGTKTKLRLVGTNAGQGKNSFAIIEEQNKNEQDVFSLEETVFGEGRLIEITPEQVKLQFADRTEILALEDGKPALAGGAAPGESASEASAPEDDQTEYTVAEAELSDALANLPVLLSQARAVPYFRNGQSIGMRLFAIRSGSLYEKLGLKNGDIITSVNENSLSDPTQALKLFEQLKNERSIKVKMERNNAQRDVSYSIR